MEMAVAVNRPYPLGETDVDLVASLEKHLASIEKHLEAVIRRASKLPAGGQEDYWALAQTSRKRSASRENRLLLREKGNPTASKRLFRSEHRGALRS